MINNNNNNNNNVNLYSAITIQIYSTALVEKDPMLNNHYYMYM